MPVDHGFFCFRFPGALLRWSQFIVKNDAVRPLLLSQFNQLLGLPFADEVAGIVFADIDQLRRSNADAERVDEFLQLIQQLLRLTHLTTVKVGTD